MERGSSTEVNQRRLNHPLGFNSINTRLNSSEGRWIAWLVPLIIVANSILFAITMFVNNCPKNSPSCIATFLGRFSFQTLKENPLLGPSSITLLKMGGLEVSKVVDRHQGWRLITCIWLHAGVFHVLVNMLSLLFIGIRLEQEFGFVHIGLLYFISGVGGSLLSALFIQSGIAVGASGAIFGLLGAILSELITNWTVYANKFSALFILIFTIASNLAVGILPLVDNFGHIGGFASGFLLGFVFLIRPQFRWISRKVVPNTGQSIPKQQTYRYILSVISLILLIVGFTVGLIMLLRGVDANEHCSWCHYLSCVPTSMWSCKESSIDCTATQSENHLNLTCQRIGKTYSLPLLTNVSDARIKELCIEVCR
ncbi:RHOMBOID-like protein 1 [Tasmannia lanceolata]|uniref:RHOMBOID-like protein 1 n=1 Tax=Tasmannia lanceolata TaxID=3420 RepID=UPI0040636BA4